MLPKLPTYAPEAMPIDVISVQSQVIYGSVGNSMAQPALQGMGYQVSVVPTVLLSNVPSYPSMHGGVIPHDWFRGFLDDLLARRALTRARAVLIGYLGSSEQCKILADWLHIAREQNPKLAIYLDPVMGDHDSGLYVEPRLPEAIRQELLPIAHGLTPNLFELEKLVGHPLNDLDSAIKAAQRTMTPSTEWLVLTSASTADANRIQIAVVTPSKYEVFSHPRLPITAKGTGDLVSARLTGYLLGGHDVFHSARLAIQDVLAALIHTQTMQSEEIPTNTMGALPSYGIDISALLKTEI